MGKQTSAASEAEIAAAEKYLDEETAAELRARKHGDALDQLRVRKGVSHTAQLLALVAGVILFCVASVFAWQAGEVVFPSLKLGALRIGGVPLIVNEVVFVLSVFLSLAEPKGQRIKSSWTWLAGVSFLFALFCIYTSQTTAAESVREIVEKEERLEREILQLEVDIEATVIPSKRPTETALTEALNEAVGSGLSTITEAEAETMCAGAGNSLERLECRQAELRLYVDCAQDISPIVRDATCTPIAAYRAALERIDDMHAQLDAKMALVAEKEAELEALPDASNKFVRDIADFGGWEIDDAQSRTYIFLGLLFLLSPAVIFAMTLERRPTQSGQQGS